MAFLKRFLRTLPLLLLSPLLTIATLLTLLVSDLFSRRRAASTSAPPRATSASIVIPNWNGKDLLEKYLVSVVEAAAGHPDNEVIVVDNGSADGSVEFIRASYPSVKVVALPENRGFGGGSNEGFRQARND